MRSAISRRHRVRLAAFVLATWSCGGGPDAGLDAGGDAGFDAGLDAGDGPSRDAGLPQAEDFAPALVRALCEGEVSVCPVGAAWRSADECVAQSWVLQPEREATRPGWRPVPWGAATLVASGSLRFDAERARACLDWTAARCVHAVPDWILFLPSPCDGVFAPAEPPVEGRACTYDFECGADMFCEEAIPAGSCGGPTVCRPRKGAGERCRRALECRGGPMGAVMCSGETWLDPAVCVPDPVVSVVGEGAACGPGDAAYGRCDEGLWCRATGGPEAPATCRRPVGSGASCATEVCGPGLGCPEPALVCVAPTALGSACVDLAECDFYRGELCDPASSRCARLGDGSLGTFCHSAWAPCVAGLECFADLRCRPPQALGERCAGFEECETSRCISGRCAPALAPGDPCLSDAECAGGCCTADAGGAPVCAGP